MLATETILKAPTKTSSLDNIKSTRLSKPNTESLQNFNAYEVRIRKTSSCI